MRVRVSEANTAVRRTISGVIIGLVLGSIVPGVLRAQQVARADGSMVVTQHRLATDAGIEMLLAGGNAVDAAVAAAFAIGVVDAANAGIGGRAQVVVRTPDGQTFAIDGTTQFPASWDPSSVPLRSAAEIAFEERSGRAIGFDMVAVPGTVAALSKTLRDFGTLELADVLAPSIRYADEGVVVEPGMLPGVDVPEEFYDLPGAPLSLFRPDGTAYQPGDTYRQPALAETLRAIAGGGPDVFYRGEIARRIANDVAANGGFLTYDDLAQYEALSGIVVQGEFRGHTVSGSYWPASGATVIQILKILDRLDSPSTIGAQWVANVARAIAFGVEDRLAGFGRASDAASWITSDSLATRRAGDVESLPSLAPPALDVGDDPPGHTTHLSVVDEDGWAVSLTQSLGDTFGSRVMTDDLGFPYAMSMGYQRDEGPRGRPGSSQSPIVVDSAGEVRAVIGAAGSQRIISSIVTTLDRRLTFGQPLDIAALAPRLHPEGGGELRLESREGSAWSSGVAERLRAAGWDVTLDAENYGILHGIAWDPLNDEWIGVADPRGPGTAKGLPRRTAGGLR